MSVPHSILFVAGSLYDPNSGPFGILHTVCALHARQNNVTVIGTRDKWQTQAPPNWGVPTVALRKRGPASFHFAPGINRWLCSMRPSPTVVEIQSVWQYRSLAAARWAHGRGIPYMVTLLGNLSPHALSVSRRKKQVAVVLTLIAAGFERWLRRQEPLMTCVYFVFLGSLGFGIFYGLQPFARALEIAVALALCAWVAMSFYRKSLEFKLSSSIQRWQTAGRGLPSKG